MFDSVEEAFTDLKQGRIVIVCDDENRENEGDFIALADKVTPETVNFMSKYGRGLVCMPITEEKAEKLQIPMMVETNTDEHETAFTVSVDHYTTGTGISAYERAKTISEIVRTDVNPDDFKKPGHIFPLVAKEGGVLERKGHTEAAVDLAKLCDEKPAAVICEVMNDDGTMARVPDLRVLADEFGLKMINIEDLSAYRDQNAIQREIEVNLPTSYGHFRAIEYEKENLALVKGDIRNEESVLVRIHSECLTGDVFGSHRCDCGTQLHSALSQIEKEGCGVLLYLRQEGRGIGLLDKLRAYKLQEEGYDTVEANEALGFHADLRDYSVAAQMLKDLNIKRIRLMTNNPLKIEGLRKYDLEIIERIPIQLPATKENYKYLQTKQDKLGHLLEF